MLVAKFGGTSVASRERVETIVEIVQGLVDNDQRPVIVVSAAAGVTNLLLERDVEGVRRTYEQLVISLFSEVSEVLEDVKGYLNLECDRAQELVNRGISSASGQDELVSFGEIISSYIISKALYVAGIPSKQVIATDLIITDDTFQSAEFLPAETEKKSRKVLFPLVEKGVVPVVTGFVGVTRNGEITTLGRGGSDYSASILGYALDADGIQIWTDVDGVFSGDPRVITSARLIPEISYKEASEMAAFGAKVLHPRTIRPAIEKNIPVRVLNTFNPQACGTLITGERVVQGLKAVSFKRKTPLVTIYSTSMLFSKGFLARIFEVFSKENISVDLVSVSEVSVSVTLDNEQNLADAVSKLEEFATVSVSHDFGIISLIGEGLMSSQDVLMEVSELLHSNHMPIRMVSLGASDINISLVLNAQDIERAANLVHDRLLLERSR